MSSYQFVCGDSDGPVAGQTKFKADFLKRVFVNFLIVDNAIENQLEPSPAFKHNYVQGELDRSPNVYTTGDKLIIDYDECSCKKH